MPTLSPHCGPIAPDKSTSVSRRTTTIRMQNWTAPSICCDIPQSPASSFTRLCSRPHYKHRNGSLVPNDVDGASQDQITDESMAMAGHRDQVALFALSRFQNL